MPDLDALVLLTLAGAGFLAGSVDAIAGGGGLIAVPALLLAGLSPSAALATNKLQGVFGVATASFVYWRAGYVDLAASAPAALAALVASAAGALVLQAVDPGFLRAFMPILLLAVGLYFLFSPSLGEAAPRPRLGAIAFALGPVALVAFYDGFFGPGAGSFYLLACIALFGLDIRRGTGTTKLFNFASNAGALLAFLIGGQIVWAAGLAMISGQVLGGAFGSRLVVRRGARLVRPLVVVTSFLLALRLALAPDQPLGRAFRDVIAQIL